MYTGTNTIGMREERRKLRRVIASMPVIRQHWQLSAGGGIDGSNYKDFTVAFELTDSGLQQRETILQALFSAIAMLKQQPLPQQLPALSPLDRQQFLRFIALQQTNSQAVMPAQTLPRKEQ